MYIYTHIYILFSILFHYGLSQILSIVSCAIQQDLVVIRSIHNNFHLLTPNSQSVPPHPPSLLATTDLSSVSVSPFTIRFICVVVQILHVSDVIGYLPFSFTAYFLSGLLHQYGNLQLHLCCSRWHHFILFMTEQYSTVYICVYINT